MKTAKLRLGMAMRLIAKRKEKRLALLEQLRAFRGRVGSDFAFDRDEANSR